MEAEQLRNVVQTVLGKRGRERHREPSSGRTVCQLRTYTDELDARVLLGNAI